ncbi:MAG: TIGR04454 family lipoprotein [Leptospira sp.]|nr:TIGR04454 family lipoprotein [Leptospira sp.]
MKKIVFLISILGLIFSMNCGGGNVYSSDQCEKTFNGLFEKMTASVSDEEKGKIAAMKPALMDKLVKDCMAGKFNLECIEKADNIAAMQTCLN